MVSATGGWSRQRKKEERGKERGKEKENQTGERYWKWRLQEVNLHLILICLDQYLSYNLFRWTQPKAPVCSGPSSAVNLPLSPLLSPCLPVTLEQGGSARCVVFVSQGPEELRPGGFQPGPRPREAVLHVCLERVGQLELWLQKAQSSLVAAGAAGSSTMQDSVEQQLLTCQVSHTHRGRPSHSQGHRSENVQIS